MGDRHTQTREMGTSAWLWVDIPAIKYPKAWELQCRIIQNRVDGLLDQDIVLLLEHPPVFTLGRRGGQENLSVPRAFLEEKGIPVIQVERGGNITYHGPGQLVAYPIVHLERAGLGVQEYVTSMEEIMIRVAQDFGVAADRSPANRGVWVADRKLGSVGIAIRRGISFHGFALNVNVDLTPFTWIQPCGLQGVRATSLKEERGSDVPMGEARQSACTHIQGVFGITLEPIQLDEFHRLLGEAPTARTIPPSMDRAMNRISASNTQGSE